MDAMQQCAQPSCRAFGVSLQELAAAGQPPIVLQDCLRWLALRGLTTPRLFSQPPRGAKQQRPLQALKHLYETNRRPLRSKSCRDKDPHLIANLLLMWLGALPEPLFPARLVPELVESQQSDFYEERLASVRGLLKRAEPFVVEALFPLFELLHHYWINQGPDRDGALQELGALLAPAVFGSPARHGLPPEDGGLLSDTVEMLISEYRPLFTQPFNLRRYEADAARQAAAAAAAAAAEATSPTQQPLGSPLLAPIRCERLSVMQPEGASPFSDCCATPLAPESPISAFVAAASAAAGGGGGVRGGFSALQAPPGAPFGSVISLAALAGEEAEQQQRRQQEEEEEDHLEQAFSSLLESTVSGMLFDSPPGSGGLPAAAGGEGKAASAPAPAAADGEQPMSPVAVLREVTSDGGESTDGSDCDAPMPGAGPGKSPFSWNRAAACGMAC